MNSLVSFGVIAGNQAERINQNHTMITIQIALFDTKRTDYVSSNGEPYSIHWKDKELDSFTIEYNTDNNKRAIAFAKRKIKAIRKTDERIKAWNIEVL